MIRKKQQKPGRFMDLTTDHGFKTAFGEKHEKLLLHFLNGVFEGQKKIVKVEHLPLKQLGFKPEDRDTIYDLYCTDEKGERYIVEMQVAQQKHFMDRCLLYAAASILKQAKSGKWNYELKPLYVIAILNFNLTEDNADYINCYTLMNEKTKKRASNKLQIVTLELPKFNKLVAELKTDLDKWLFCIKHQAELPEQPAELKGEIFDELFEITDLKTLTEEDMTAYEKSFERCYGVELAADYARERGIQQGLEQGLQRGLQKGRQEGLKQGLKRGRVESVYEIAKRCIQEGMPLDLVIRLTNLTPKELKGIGLK